MMMLTACSSEEIPEVKAAKGNAISFSTAVSSKAQSLYSSNGYDFRSFQLYARATTTDGTIGADYFLDETFVKQNADENLWIISGEPRFWLESGLDFYAHVNGASESVTVSERQSDGTFADKIHTYAGLEWDMNALPKITFAVPADPTKQKDLLVAYNGAVTRPVGTSTSSLNFRHALSQVVFQAKNTNSQMRVEIFQVSLVNVMAKGTFSYPQADATTNNTNANTHIEKDANGNDVINTDNNNLTADMWGARDITSKFIVPTPGESENYVNVRYQKNTDKDGNQTDAIYNLTNSTAGALMMIPQRITAGAVATDGAHLLVKIKVYNVGPNGTDLCIFGNDSADGVEVLVPMGDVNWQPGRRYIYTLNFGNNAGYDPNNPVDPTLKDIRFTISVDDYSWQEGEILLNPNNYTNSNN